MGAVEDIVAQLLASRQPAPAAPAMGSMMGNSVRVLPADYNTKLPAMDEFQFRNWVDQNKVPFDPNAGTTDYDMRGFYQAAQQGQPGIATAVNANDGLMHYPDRFKTPLHQSFSNESQWAGPGAPQWTNDSQLAAPSGRIVFDEKNR